MAVFKTYSQRAREAETGGKIDVYLYDEIPGALRVQICFVLQDLAGRSDRRISTGGYRGSLWRSIEDQVIREAGVLSLGVRAFPDSRLVEVLTDETRADVPTVLDIIEIAFACARRTAVSSRGLRLSEDISAAVEELNQRFQMHGVGYQYVDGRIVRVDSEYMHAEAVLPALRLLRGQGFEGPHQEFLSAHEHYRHGKTEACLVEALKAFESTLKVVIQETGGTPPKRATASALVAAFFDAEVIPNFMQDQFHALPKLMETGVPTVRNKRGGHGQGAKVVDVPLHVAAYGLHLAASNIVFVVECLRHNQTGSST